MTYPSSRSLYFYFPEGGTIVVSAYSSDSMNLVDYAIRGDCTLIAHIARKTASGVGMILKKFKDFKKRISSYRGD